MRWRAPQPVAAWSDARKAQAFGPACMQEVRPNTPNWIKREDMSEDCLTINVFRPANAKSSLPVMVWIHGGALVTGASSVPVYDGTEFAKGGVVVVSMNYRLGRLGFFAHPTLTKENADGHLGNYGLLDQIAALKWVQKNITAFGGDPKNVTIFGESAGGLSVNALMISPEARGLFHKAISQSGYGRGYFTRVSQATPDGRKSGEAEGVDLAATLGLKDPDLTALRNVPAGNIVDVPTGTASLNFYLDGKTITDDMWAVFRKGQQAPVPFMLGSNGLEFPNSPPGQRVVSEFLTAAEEEALKPHYGVRPASIDHLGSDILFTQQARALARFHTQNKHPTYVYLFDVVPAEDAATLKGARHADELPYVFGNLMTFKKPITSDGGKAVSKIMIAQWRAFAKTGTPNGHDLPVWPAYDGQHIMEYKGDGASAHADTRNERLDALSKIIDPKS